MKRSCGCIPYVVPIWGFGAVDDELGETVSYFVSTWGSLGDTELTMGVGVVRQSEDCDQSCSLHHGAIETRRLACNTSGLMR